MNCVGEDAALKYACLRMPTVFEDEVKDEYRILKEVKEHPSRHLVDVVNSSRFVSKIRLRASLLSPSSSQLRSSHR